MKQILFIFILVVSVLVYPILSEASIISNYLIFEHDSLLPGMEKIDFSQFDHDLAPLNGLVQIGGLVGEDITVSSALGQSLIGNGTYDLGYNRSWNPQRNGYLVSEHDREVLLFDFHDNPVSGVAGFIDFRFDSAIDTDQEIDAWLKMAAYDENDQLFAVAELLVTRDNIDDPLINQGDFYGFTWDENRIYSFSLSGEIGGVDDLGFSRSTPEPVTGLLFSMGLFGLFPARRKRKNKE